ncbi:MAG TPA: LuxR C-terminal-related transcriptional regulator [Streptosporangiaceae bacterium]|nr:LuxR C-terminal-related transcriptional regulator [Streptosporangiaceae bacterium]
MVEPPFAAPSQAASERDVLLATKLHVPRPRPDLVPRPRLAERLDEGLARGLMLVCAPAGYGKTVLLADWVRRCHPPAAWLSLDVGDNDPARFWRHGVAALDQARPGLAERVGPLLGPPAPSSYEGLVTALINELAAGPDADQVLLVLDDYHLIDSEAVHESLGFLLEHRPPGLRLVLASRSDPPLALARLRGRGQLAELRAAELRFTVDEAAALLQVAAGPNAALPGAEVEALVARTEGWAAGLQLAGMSLRGHEDVARFVGEFTGSNRYVLDYLAEEVLERQSGPMRTFLLETSVLERLSGALCDAVTGRAGSQALLEQIEAAGLFVVPLDEVRGWWRYHHLFADLLRARLQEEQPGRAAQLHCNAAAWYEEHGLADDAIGHAVAAGQMTWAARIIEQHFDVVFNFRGEVATIHRWLSVLPAEVVRSRPRLLLAQALMAVTSGHLEVVEPLLDAVECAPPGWADEPFEPTAGVAASHLVNVPALTTLHRGALAQLRGDAEATAAFAAQMLAESKPGERLLSATAHGFLAVAEWLRGRLTDAERAFAASVTGWCETSQPTLIAWGYYELVLIRRGQGRLDAAALTCEQALDSLVTSGRPPPAAGPSYVGLAEIAYQRDELDLALRHAIEGIGLCRQFVYTPPLADGLATLAMIRQATGDPAGALAAITEAEQASPGPPGLLNPVPAQRARLLLAQGDLPAAARFTQERALSADDEPDYPREPGYLVLARVLLAQDRPDRALALLNRLHAAAAAQDRTGSLIEIGALRALALAVSGEEAGAVAALAQALTLACPQGYVRIFADEGPPMAALLGRLIAAQRAGQAAAEVPLGCLARLQRAFDPGHAMPVCGRLPAGAVPGLVEPLTSRELEVLGMLAVGRSNQAVAGELVVTIDTVKKHVSHILDKLGTANRTEAVSRARELGLIP